MTRIWIYRLRRSDIRASSRHWRISTSRLSLTKNKYQRKTDNFIEFLKEVESGSDELDQQLTDAITVSEEGE